MFCRVGPGLGRSWIVVTNHDGRNCRESVEQLAVVWQKEDKLRIPLQCRQTVLKLAHSIPLAGHMGRDKATQRVSQRFYWSTVYWRTTARAMRTVQRRATRVCNMITLPNIEEPFEKIAMDITGPLPHSQAGHRYVLVVYDYATRYPEAMLLWTIGIPKEILTEVGSNITSQQLAKATDFYMYMCT